VLGWWAAFRLVNMPNFADFLIAVEAEMNKVTWPSRTELVRSSIVVILTILLLAGILYGYDLFWNAVLMAIGVLQTGS
jgi:preprotein translocase subunit SecE